MKVFLNYCRRDKELAEALAAYLNNLGNVIVCHDHAADDAEEFSSSSSELRSSDAVVAILSESNREVFLEIGVAIGASVAILIAAPSAETLPKHLRNIPYVQLTGSTNQDAQKIARRTLGLKGLSTPTRPDFSSAEATLRAAVLDPALLESLAPCTFECLLFNLLKDRGFDVSRTEGKGEGFDFILRRRSDQRVVLVQAKKPSKQGLVSLETISAFLGALSSREGVEGVVVSTAAFTKAASELAARASVRLLSLEDVLAAKFIGDMFESRHGA